MSDRAWSLFALTSSSLSSVSTSCPFSSSVLSWSSFSMWSEPPSTRTPAHTQNEEYCPVAIHNPLTHVLGNLDAEWRNRNIGRKMDNIHLTSIAYADDICLLASSKKDLEHRWFPGCRLGNGIGQNLFGPAQHAHRTQLTTYAGANIHLCSNSGSAMTNRLQKATGVFEKWSSMLCDSTLGLSKRSLCFKASVLSSLGWQSGSWTLTRKTGGTSGFLGCAAPRSHARAEKRTRGRHWPLAPSGCGCKEWVISA